MRTLLTSGRMRLPDELGPRGDTPDFVNLHDTSCVVKRRWGRGGLGVEWSHMTFGIPSRATRNVLSYCLVERAADLRGFDGIATQLCAIPIYGYRWRSGDAWTKVDPGWAFGFFEEGDHPRFLIAASEEGEDRIPVIADWPMTCEWLMSEQWNQMRLLREAAAAAGTEADAVDRRAAG